MKRRSYFPVLRNKRAEWAALAKINDSIASDVRPIIEPLPANLANGGEEGLAKSISNHAIQDWRHPILLDPHLIHDAAATRAITAIIQCNAGKEGRISPVHTPLRSREYADSIARLAQISGHAAVRISTALLQRPALIAKAVAEVGLKPASLTFIVDRQIVSDDSPFGPRELTAIPNWEEFGAIVILGGSFPPDLTGFKIGQHQHPRSDWLSWKKSLSWASQEFREVDFGDYTIQHPEYVEPKASFMNFSASIRYAAEEYWVIMRGEGVRNPGGPGYAQWPANAMLLTERSEFKGSDYSFGDSYISVMASDGRKPGNPETWLRAGINHHITLTVRQLAAISSS